MNVPERFGSMVFNEPQMRKYLPEDAYRALKNTIAQGRPLDLGLANAVAEGMKEWALNLGATHYTHWFHPMSGQGAEKHESFISPVGDGRVMMEFSGSELIKGEPDASSFPSGGLRCTFEARGYTAWDPSSYAFVREGTLYIPTAFCTHGGEALDKKTPLLRSMEALSAQARRILRLFGTDCHVTQTVGAEQEYFLVDRKYYYERKDLTYTGRTLFGAPPPKGQELDDHYYGFIKTRVSAYMRDLNEELWQLGILAKTEHNEAAPGQHELAPIFQTANVATDHNQLIMDCMRKVAKRHDLACLLHEKPFAGMNGSGKHVNWSMSTMEGENLLEPGKTPGENAQFLLFLVAILRGVNLHQDLLRISIATAGNDLRLGAGEAPPAIVSMYVGDELEEVLQAIENKLEYASREAGEMRIGVDVLPGIPKDLTDRNRTSPFAFTGNKFEFRMPGSGDSIAEPITVLNTIVADSLAVFAEELERAKDFGESLNALIRREIKANKRVLFSGNGYDKAWVEEAKTRGLLNLESTAEALPHLTAPKNIELFYRHGVYSKVELQARQEILLENYCKLIKIEAQTMLEMVRRDILPSGIAYGKVLADTLVQKREANLGLACVAEKEILAKVGGLTDQIYEKTNALHALVVKGEGFDRYGTAQAAAHFRQAVIPAMECLRRVVDELEVHTSKAHWPYPSYGRLVYLH